MIQVSYTLDDDDTLKREIGGLTEACKYFKVDKADIIIFDEYKDYGQRLKELKAENITINVIPAWQFLLLH